MYKKPYNILIIIVLLLTLYGCKGEVEIKEHVISNDDLSSYIIIQAKTYHIYNFEDKLEKTTRFNITLNIDSKNTDQKSATYDVKAKNIIGEEMKYTSKSPTTLPARIPLVNNTNIGGNGLDEFIYIINNGSEHNFYEKVMYVTNKDIDNKGYPEELDSDIVFVNFLITEDDEKYNMEVILDANEPIHIDLQSFLVSDDANIYSFFGLYGYKMSESSYSIENNYIYKEMNMKFIYLRITYYNENGTKTELRAKYSLENIL